MDFGAGRGGFCEEDQMIHGGNLPFSSSPSSCQYKGLDVPLTNGRYAAQPQRGWLGNNSSFRPQEESSRSYDAGAAATLELMGVSPKNEEDDDEGDARRGDSSQTLGGGIEREHMFDKVVTPSDVGKLNRLVIPKQHAEKYFPLDSSTNDKGLLLNFEDRGGKPWRFRYSYWNSSQSYVMTKGWSRFVKEKRLDAGDIVSFQRGVGELGKDRLFIDWRRRPNAAEATSIPLAHHFSFHRSVPFNPLFLQPPAAARPAPQDNSYFPQQQPNNYHPYHRNSYGYHNVVSPPAGSVFYLRSAAAAPQEMGVVQVQQTGGGRVEPMVFESVPVVHGKAAAKRLRLFGVNMECPISESDECDILSSTTIPNVTMPSHHSSSTHPPPPPTLQFRLYNGSPLPTMPTDLLNKGKASMSLDLDI
ncbi:hypothetical protein L1049_022583 [Liquidambar formosana]|uniref:TF-B3 domain-containing protein n=1 Tax=Liquidambar formosana TaxID=63359 RepID=A0AAP0WRQ1_LIQFO